jgi:peptidoglycan/xylan/chitin deacetylase (PgdA/CDA1 family)
MLIIDGVIGRAPIPGRPPQHRPRVRLPILMYHRVGPSKSDVVPALTVSPDDFAEQVDWLARHSYSPITTSQLFEPRALPTKPVLITFDDGYADIARYALPILLQYGFTAVSYIVTGLIGETNEWDRRAGWGELQLLTRQQITEWAAKGFEFGSHTRNHPDLRIISPSELEEEVFGSAADLQSILGTAPESFAYPFGYFNLTVRDCVARAYRTSVTVSESICSDQDDPYLMPRIMIWPSEGLSTFARRVKFGQNVTFQRRMIAYVMRSCKTVLRRQLLISALRKWSIA